MDIKRLSTRGVLFTFYELGGFETNIYVIDGMDRIFIVDTFLGPDAILQVKNYINENFKEKPIIVFNSHFHWDHIWGNCCFKDSIIISHKSCREIIKNKGGEELAKHNMYRMGSVEIVYPNLTFEKSIEFPDDGVYAFHSPGHTIDSVSLVDTRDRILLTGDNVERPIPYMESHDLDSYINTMKGYLSMDAEYIIGGHCHEEGKRIIEDNLRYLRMFKGGDTKEYETGEYADTHFQNMKFMGMNIG